MGVRGRTGFELSEEVGGVEGLGVEFVGRPAPVAWRSLVFGIRVCCAGKRPSSFLTFLSTRFGFCLPLSAFEPSSKEHIYHLCSPC